MGGKAVIVNELANGGAVLGVDSRGDVVSREKVRHVELRSDLGTVPRRVLSRVIPTQPSGQRA